MAQIKKLSVATVCGKLDVKAILNSAEPIKLMRVIGQAVDQKRGESSYGDWTALLGRFKATNLATGEISEAATLFLPEVALIPLQVALAAGPVMFAIEISVKSATNVKPGGSVYEYTWEPLLPPTDSDPIKQMEERLLALSAPASKLAGEGNPGDTPDPAANLAGKGSAKPAGKPKQ